MGCVHGARRQALEKAGVKVGLLPTESSPRGIIKELRRRLGGVEESTEALPR